MLISQDRYVMRLEGGDFILVTSKSKVFKVKRYITFALYNVNVILFIEVTNKQVA